jgi:transposase InsO family protein
VDLTMIGTLLKQVHTGASSGEMIRDLMLEATEKRFGPSHTPQPIQWLSDNGGAFRAYDTIDFVIGLGLVPCFAPVRSRQSNGMAEAFVKTFKRDHVYVHEGSARVPPGCVAAGIAMEVHNSSCGLHQT